ncbi:MAG: hypothetical protein AAB017_06400 [Nitrospirota bacterium]
MDTGQKRQLNERKFPNWENLSNGSRKYWLEVKGKHGWKARYVKEVNEMEETLKFYQEVYDKNGRLVEIHEKYPADKGHQKTEGG